MPTLDVAMPVALFFVVTIALLLNKRVEGKLMSTVEEKEFKTRDVVLLVVFMAIIISALAYAAMINPGAIFEDVILVFFLSSYTMLLFTISYVFSTYKNPGSTVFRGFWRCRRGCRRRLPFAPFQDAFTFLGWVLFLV